MLRWISRLAVAFTTAALAFAQWTEENPAEWAAYGRLAERVGDLPAAEHAYTRAIELGGGPPALAHRRGEIRLQLGEVDGALADFDQALEENPELAPYSWQRGIALYEAGRFHGCRRQFELHRTVNPDDVENSAWHFLCNARATSFEQARREVIRAEDDPRVPMKEVLALFAGEGSEADVLAAAQAGETNERERANRMFYARFYLGLYQEARGRVADARESFRQAVEGADLGHPMWLLAKVHLARFEQGHREALGDLPSTSP